MYQKNKANHTKPIQKNNNNTQTGKGNMLLSRSNTRGQNEPRYSQDELILALQKSPKHAAEATGVVLSTLRALRNSAFVWQYAIRRLRTACLVIQRIARRITTASKLSIAHAVRIWTADDEKIRVDRLDSITLAEKWRSESPFPFFTMEARVRTITQEYERQRRSFRQFFRKYLRELRNLELSTAMLEAGLSKSRRQLFSHSNSANGGDARRVSTDQLAQSPEQRRSLFAGSLAAGLRSSVVLLQAQESRRSTAANQGLRGIPRIFDSIAHESASSSERSVTPPSRSLSLSVSAEPNGARRSVSSNRSHGLTKTEKVSQGRARSTIRDSEERLIRAYNELHAFRQQVPVFEFVVDLKVLREKAMESYTAEAQKRVDETIKGLGVASSEWLSHRVAKDYALLSASVDGIVATKTEITQTKVKDSESPPRLSLGVTLKSLTDMAQQNMRVRERGGGTLRSYRAEARLEDAVSKVSALNTSSSRGVGIHSGDLVIRPATEQIDLNKVSLVQASPIHVLVAEHPMCPSTKDGLQETSGEKSPAEPHTHITELEEQLTSFLRKRGQGGGSSSFSWSSRMQPHTPRAPRPKQGTGDNLEEARTPCPPSRAITMVNRNIRLRHRLTNVRDLNATILAEQQTGTINKSLPEDVNANRAAHLRELTSQERVRHVEEQISRALSKDYVLAQNPSSKFVVPPRHLRVSTEELNVLDGFYPYHRFKEVHHEGTSVNNSKFRVGSSVAHGNLHESDSCLEVSRSNERPKVVVVDHTSGKVSIQKHLLRHSYPSEYNAYRERLRGSRTAGQKESTCEANRVVAQNNKDASISPRLSVDLMDRIMAEHDFSGATRLLVREVAANWTRENRQVDHTDRLTETEADVNPFARLESDDLSTSSAPFRRAPSSNSLKAPLTTLTSRRNHSRGITVVTVIDSLDESAVVCDGSRTEDGGQTGAAGKCAPKGTNADETGQKISRLWANTVSIGDSSSRRPQSTAASRGQQSSMRVHSKHLVATGAFDGSLRITSFPDLVEVCYFQARSTGMISILKVSEDKQTLCAAADDGFVRIFKKRGPLNQWLSSWDLVQCLEISKSSGSQALSIALYGREHLAVGCYGGLLYVLPLSPARLSSSMPSSSELGDHQPNHRNFQTQYDSSEKEDRPTRHRDIPLLPNPSAQSVLGRHVPIELAAVLKLETNVSGVNKLLSYSDEMLITGGLDGQCNVIRLAYGEKAVRSMHERRAESDAALSRAIAVTLGVNDLPSLSPGGCETIDALLPATISSPSASVTNATRAFTVRASLTQRSLPDCIKSPGESVRTRAPPALPPFAVETARPFTCHSAAIVDLAYVGPFGDLVCSAGLDKRICVWDALSFDLRFTFTLASVLRSPVVVIPTSQCIVCPLEDCTIVTLSAGSGSVLHETSADQLRDPCVAGCLLPPHFRSNAPHLVAFGTYGGRILVFDPSSGSFIASKVVHSGAVMCMSYCESKLYNGSLTSSSNLAEQFLVSCSDDRVTSFTSFKAT